jgi:hypothetical protein
LLAEPGSFRPGKTRSPGPILEKIALESGFLACLSQINIAQSSTAEHFGWGMTAGKKLKPD